MLARQPQLLLSVVFLTVGEDRTRQVQLHEDSPRGVDRVMYAFEWHILT